MRAVDTEPFKSSDSDRRTSNRQGFDAVIAPIVPSKSSTFRGPSSSTSLLPFVTSEALCWLLLRIPELTYTPISQVRTAKPGQGSHFKNRTIQNLFANRLKSRRVLLDTM